MKNQTKDTFNESLDIFEERYYVLNKRMLCFVGQWPYQSFREKLLRSGFLTLLTFSLLIPQINNCIVLLRPFENMGAFIESVAVAVTNFGFTLKLVNLVFNSEKIKTIFDLMSDDWGTVRQCLPETKILQAYGERGRLYTVCYMILINGVVAGWVTLPSISVIMDYFIPLNETRPHLILFPADYGLEDPDKHFWWISIHGGVTCVLGMQMFVANDTLFMIMSTHACAMLAVLRYRLEIIPRKDGSSAMLKRKNNDEISYEMIVSCIKSHNRIIKFVRLIEASCEWGLVVVIVANVLVMTFTGAQIVAKETVPRDAVRFAFFAIAQVVHLFYNTLPGHCILVTSSRVQESAYNCRWYLLAPRSRRLLVLFIRRGLEPLTITAGKLYVMSMENFCGVLQTTMSYFTMLTSTQ